MTVQRWKCTSYCLCGSRKGHFEKSDDEGVWVRYEAAHALEQENERLRKVLEDIGSGEIGINLCIKVANKALTSPEPQSAPHK